MSMKPYSPSPPRKSKSTDQSTKSPLASASEQPTAHTQTPTPPDESTSPDEQTQSASHTAANTPPPAQWCGMFTVTAFGGHRLMCPSLYNLGDPSDAGSMFFICWCVDACALSPHFAVAAPGSQLNMHSARTDSSPRQPSGGSSNFPRWFGLGSSRSKFEEGKEEARTNRLDSSICDPNTLLAMARLDRESRTGVGQRSAGQSSRQKLPHVQCEEDVLYIPSPLLPDFGGRFARFNVCRTNL